jgi:uncharacterized membrane protein YfcA
MESGVASREAFTMAVATSVAFVLVSSLSAARSYSRQSLINYRLVTVVSAGSLIGIVSGIYMFTKADDVVVRHYFGIFIWLLGAYILISKYYKLGSEFSGKMPTLTFINKSIMFAVGGVVGVLVSAFGIGGGGVIAPATSYATRSDMKAAVATGVAATVTISLMTTAGFVLDGMAESGGGAYALGWLHLPALALLVPCALLAAPLGARLSMKLSHTVLMSILGLSMFAVGLKMIME